MASNAELRSEMEFYQGAYFNQLQVGLEREEALEEHIYVELDELQREGVELAVLPDAMTAPIVLPRRREGEAIKFWVVGGLLVATWAFLIWWWVESVERLKDAAI